ncbi:2018_t:CDS:1, partial [Acaulospora morrowiae]
NPVLVEKWELFQNWLNDSELNIKIQCLVKFGQEFYHPFAEFLIGYDSHPRVIQPDNSLQCLPPGRRAYQMLDFVNNLTRNFTSILKNLYLFFGDKLLQSTETMDNSQIELLVKKLKQGIQKGLELHQKWLDCWLYLPLSMCLLGEDNAKKFACSYWHVVLKKPWPEVSSVEELCYAKFLEVDIVEEFNDFGFKNTLNDELFFKNLVYSLINQQFYFINVHSSMTSLKIKFDTLLSTSNK